jgi:hypothetical protein
VNRSLLHTRPLCITCLRNASKAQLKSWRLIGNGVGIHWEKIDEDLSLEGFLAV